MTILDRSFLAVAVIFLAVQGLKGGEEMPDLSSPEFYNLRNAVELSEDGSFSVGDLTWVIKENSESGYKCYPWDEVKEELCRKAALWDEHEKAHAIMDWQKDSIEAAEGEEWAELRRKATLWEHAGWRAQVQLVRERIEWAGDKPLKVAESEYLAKAFVRTARDLKLPLWIAVAIAQKESNFNQRAVGKAGEVSLMQVKPLKGRPMEKIKADPAFAIRWAMESCFYPGYLTASKGEGGDSLSAIGHGLRHYNNSGQYVDEVISIGEKMIGQDSLWKVVPG